MLVYRIPFPSLYSNHCISVSLFTLVAVNVHKCLCPPLFLEYGESFFRPSLVFVSFVACLSFSFETF